MPPLRGLIRRKSFEDAKVVHVRYNVSVGTYLID